MASMFSYMPLPSPKTFLLAPASVAAMSILCAHPLGAQLLDPTLKDQNVRDQIDRRTHNDDYRARMRRARAAEKFIEERRRASMEEEEEEEEEEQNRDRKDEPGRPMPDDSRDTDDNSAGLRFNKSTFQDTDFSKDDFTDLMLNGSEKAGDKDFAPDDQAALGKTVDTLNRSADLKDDDQDSDMSLHAEKDTKDDDKKRKSPTYFDELSQLMQAPPPLGPNDWVPDKLDPLDNGGFTTSPDNGSPVPYRLNGHVDLERNVPWLHDQ